MHLDPKTWWYVSRATGFVAWALLAASVLWGLFITNKTFGRSTPPAWVVDLHRHLGGLAVAFVAVHLAVLPLDTYTSWGWQDLFVPMASRWHPIPIAAGVVALYLLLAVEVSSLLGRRVPRAWWRRIHLLSFPLYVLASIHLFAAGTDAGNPVAQWMVVVVSTLIVFLTGVRLLAATKPKVTSNRIAPAARAARVAPHPPTPTPERGPVAASAANGDLLPSTVARDVGSSATLTLDRPRPGMRPMSVDERGERIRARSRAAAMRQRS